MKHEIEILPCEGDLVISIKEKLQAAGTPLKVSIYRVPPYLRELSDPEAYTPQVVSLGPYHHGSPRLRQMERHKWRALQCMLSRHDQEVDIYVASMKQLEYEARACYEGQLELNSNQFIEMMLFDGCFILEILLGNFHRFETLGYGENDPIFSSQRIIWHSIERDMIMLENQIPLVVLDELLRLQLKCPHRMKGLAAQLIRELLDFFGRLRPHHALSTAVLSLVDQDSHHLLDLIRRSCFYEGPEKVASNPTGPVLLDHCVTELIMDAGINIRIHETDSLLDIKFNDGTLYIPPILIDYGTKFLLKNLIAFEQCHHCKKDITSYVLFLDSLIDTAVDIRFLRHCNIIEHWLDSDEEVANLFNCLGKEVALDLNDSNFSDLSEMINIYYRQQRKWTKWYTWLWKISTSYWRKRKWDTLRNSWLQKWDTWLLKWDFWLADLNNRYFKTPWTIISLLAGVLLLLLTAVQTFYGVYSYYLPNN